MKKVYDIVAAVGSYEDRDGNEKKRYQNVGSVFKGDKGPFIVFKRWFNPAAVESKPGDDSIFLSLFEPKEDDKPAARPSRDEEPRRAAQSRRQATVEDDDIPF